MASPEEHSQGLTTRRRSYGGSPRISGLQAGEVQTRYIACRSPSQRGESYGMAFADVYRGGADNAGIFQCGRDHGMVGGYFS